MKLPPELLWRVVDHLQDHKETLGNLALSNSIFSERAQSLMFKEVPFIHGPEDMKKGLRMLRRDDCRLGKHVREIEVSGQTLFTEEEVYQYKSHFEEVQYRGKEFVVHMVALICGLRRWRHTLKMIINTDWWLFPGRDDEARGCAAVFGKCAALCFGSVEARGLFNEIELVDNSGRQHDLNWLHGKASDLSLPIDNETTPGFNGDIFRTNMNGLKKFTIYCYDNDEDSIPIIRSEGCDAMCAIIIAATGATELKLEIQTGVPVALKPLKGSRLVCLNLTRMYIYSHEVSSILKSCSQLRSLELREVGLDLTPRDQLEPQEPWEALFVCIGNLPLTKLRIYRLHTDHNHEETCYQNDPLPALITARDEDISALKMMAKSMLSRKVSLGYGFADGGYKIIKDAEEIPVCKHFESEQYDDRYYEQCPARPWVRASK